MNKRIIKTVVIALLCVFTMQVFTGCYKPADEEERERMERESKTEQATEAPTEEPIDFTEAICGTYLVSGTGVMTGGAVYDDEGPETTFTKLSLHVTESGKNTVEIDVEGDHAGSGTVSADSPTVSYKDSMGYDVTVTFTVNKDGGAHADMKIFGDLSIKDTGERCTETITLSGDK